MRRKMKYYITISGLSMAISTPEAVYWWEELRPFLMPVPADSVQVDYKIEFGICPVRTGIFLGDYTGFSFYRSGDEYLIKMKDVRAGHGQVVALVLSPADMKGRIYLPEYYQNHKKEELNFSAFLGIEIILPIFHRIMMHASAVCCHGEGILFTGPSGMGKSTQAELWRRWRGAEILNGDRAILQLGNEIKVWGSPYAGSSRIYRNESCPVRAIVLLGQGPQNEIHALSGKEKIAALYPRFLLAQWDENLLHKQLGMLEEVIQRIPVYHFVCRPDESAVELAERTIFS